MSMRNGVTPKLKLILTLTLTLTDTEGAVLTLMLGYRSLYIMWQQHHNCRIVCELSLHILICILPNVCKCASTSNLTSEKLLQFHINIHSFQTMTANDQRHIQNTGSTITQFHANNLRI